MQFYVRGAVPREIRQLQSAAHDTMLYRSHASSRLNVWVKTLFPCTIVSSMAGVEFAILYIGKLYNLQHITMPPTATYFVVGATM